MTVEEFVEKYGGHYKNYRDGWLLQCPLPGHDDNSPSFSLSTTGLFNCWGCGQKGNFTRLLHDVAGFSWKKSSEIVGLLDLRKKWTQKKKRLYEQDGKPTISQAVLGLYDVDWFDAYELYQTHGKKTAYHRPPWALVFDKGFLPDTLTHFDAGYDRDEQRITIPVWNDRKELFGLLGRACRHGEFKYVPYQNFNYTDHVYNLGGEGEWGAPVVLVEGAFDVWMLWQWKIPLTAVATMTSHISEHQLAQILERHSRINIFYDDDEAGVNGAQDAARRLTRLGGKVDIIRTVRGIRDVKQMDRASFMRAYRNRIPYPCELKARGN